MYQTFKLRYVNVSKSATRVVEGSFGYATLIFLFYISSLQENNAEYIHGG